MVAVLVTTAPSSASAQPVAEPSVRVFPRASLFAPLSADPRWPRFTIGYTRYFDDSQFTHVGTAEAGAELRPITAKTNVPVQLLMAVDLESWQQNDWVPDVSFIAGATLDPIGESNYRVDFLIRYYIGRSPNGQFFTERIQTLGPAVQLYF